MKILIPYIISCLFDVSGGMFTGSNSLTKESKILGATHETDLSVYSAEHFASTSNSAEYSYSLGQTHDANIQPSSVILQEARGSNLASDPLSHELQNPTPDWSWENFWNNFDTDYENHENFLVDIVRLQNEELPYAPEASKATHQLEPFSQQLNVEGQRGGLISKLHHQSDSLQQPAATNNDYRQLPEAHISSQGNERPGQSNKDHYGNFQSLKTLGQIFEDESPIEKHNSQTTDSNNQLLGYKSLPENLDDSNSLYFKGFSHYQLGLTQTKDIKLHDLDKAHDNYAIVENLPNINFDYFPPSALFETNALLEKYEHSAPSHQLSNFPDKISHSPSYNPDKSSLDYSTKNPVNNFSHLKEGTQLSRNVFPFQVENDSSEFDLGYVNDWSSRFANNGENNYAISANHRALPYSTLDSSNVDSTNLDKVKAHQKLPLVSELGIQNSKNTNDASKNTSSAQSKFPFNKQSNRNQHGSYQFPENFNNKRKIDDTFSDSNSVEKLNHDEQQLKQIDQGIKSQNTNKLFDNIKSTDNSGITELLPESKSFKKSKINNVDSSSINKNKIEKFDSLLRKNNKSPVAQLSPKKIASKKAKNTNVDSPSINMSKIKKIDNLLKNNKSSAAKSSTKKIPSNKNKNINMDSLPINQNKIENIDNSLRKDKSSGALSKLEKINYNKDKSIQSTEEEGIETHLTEISLKNSKRKEKKIHAQSSSLEDLTQNIKNIIRHKRKRHSSKVYKKQFFGKSIAGGLTDYKIYLNYIFENKKYFHLSTLPVGRTIMELSSKPGYTYRLIESLGLGEESIQKFLELDPVGCLPRELENPIEDIVLSSYMNSELALDPRIKIDEIITFLTKDLDPTKDSEVITLSNFMRAISKNLQPRTLSHLIFYKDFHRKVLNQNSFLISDSSFLNSYKKMKKVNQISLEGANPYVVSKLKSEISVQFGLKNIVGLGFEDELKFSKYYESSFTGDKYKDFYNLKQAWWETTIRAVASVSNKIILLYRLFTPFDINTIGILKIQLKKFIGSSRELIFEIFNILKLQKITNSTIKKVKKTLVLDSDSVIKVFQKKRQNRINFEFNLTKHLFHNWLMNRSYFRIEQDIDDRINITKSLIYFLGDCEKVEMIESHLFPLKKYFWN
ncbi:hypothetical protein BY996DRAFT_6411568 [Phakopsora pachyrhizi]|nr:hypothetical protein BY996DRAFT_6411568 [Phakopsora pachyrhizi]